MQINLQGNAYLGRCEGKIIIHQNCEPGPGVSVKFFKFIANFQIGIGIFEGGIGY